VENIRVRNLCEGEETTYIYDNNAKLSKLLVKITNGTLTKYVYGRGLIGEETNGEFKTYHFDSRGSTVAFTDEQGNITDTFAYDTYGKLLARTGETNAIFLYNGRDGVITEPNGLIYMRARYYSTELRRFINADIVAGEITNAITLNRYAYANANPVSFVDPQGLSVGSSKFVHAFSNDGASESKPKDSRGEDKPLTLDEILDMMAKQIYSPKSILEILIANDLISLEGTYEHTTEITPFTEIYCNVNVSLWGGPITANMVDYLELFEMDSITDQLAKLGDMYSAEFESSVSIYSDEYVNQYINRKLEVNAVTGVATLSNSLNTDFIFESGSTVTLEQGIRQKIIKPNKRLAYDYAFAPAYNRDAISALWGKYDFPGMVDYIYEGKRKSESLNLNLNDYTKTKKGDNFTLIEGIAWGFAILGMALAGGGGGGDLSQAQFGDGGNLSLKPAY